MSTSQPHRVVIHVENVKEASKSELGAGTSDEGEAAAALELQPVANTKPNPSTTTPSTLGVEPVVGTVAMPTAGPESVSPLSTSTFPLSIENIQRLFRTETSSADVLNIINDEYGGVGGLLQKLGTGVDGLDAELVAARSQTVADRVAFYGENTLPVAIPRTFLSFCADVLEDPILRILVVAGGLTIVLGSIDEETRSHGWYEGVAIVLAVTLVTLVSAMNNYSQQKEFAAVDVSKELDPITVIRSGKQFSVDPTDVLVGDLVIMSAGQRIPADGVLIQLKGKELKVNESSATGETGLVEKIPNKKPLMMGGTEVVSGSAVMVVVLVGINTSYGQTLASLVEEEIETPLQRKLKHAAQTIGYMGTGFAVATFIALLGYWIDGLNGSKPSVEGWQDLLKNVVVCIGIVVVSVPEGLPLAVTVSLAYSMKAMLKDNILVRELSACETMGNATAICSDKTGTLTQNRMTVQRVYIGQQMFDRVPDKEEVAPTVLRMLEQGIILNSSAWIEAEHIDHSKSPADWPWKDGNQTEVSLLAWLINYGFDVNEVRGRLGSALKVSEPFDSIKKYSSIIVEKSAADIAAEEAIMGPGAKPKRYRQFYKGAAEAIIAQTDRQLNIQGVPVPLVASGGVLQRELNDYVSEFSRRGLRCIATAYRDLDELPKKTAPNSEEETKEGDGVRLAAVEKVEGEIVTDAVLIAISGLADPLRPTSYRSVRLCQRAGIVVRMVTGDHVETARFISRECGIWTSKSHICMTGAEFRKMMAEADEATKKSTVEQLRVLARSSPQDKQVLVKYLQSLGEVVAATGDGTNDAPALKSADVGIAMFLSGTAVCKSAADLWLMDDNFASIVAAVVWGRCVFDNIRKFLAFQLTVNVVALFLSLVGALTDYPLPLSTVQLLWINLIMDTAAAVALGTEQPIAEELLSRRPKPVEVPLISKAMWFKIFTQSSYQLAVCFYLLYRVQDLFPDVVLKSTEHKTLIFNCFTWMQLGNSFNGRRVLPSFDVFGRIFENFYFLGIMIGAMAMQVLMVEAFGAFANTTHQTGPMWGVALLTGAFIWLTGFAFTALWNIIVRYYPEAANDDTKRILGPQTFEGAHLTDARYSFKRPDHEEPSQLRQRQHSKLEPHVSDGPVAMALDGPAHAGSMSARRAASASHSANQVRFGSQRRGANQGTMPFQAVHAEPAVAGPAAHAVIAVDNVEELI